MFSAQRQMSSKRSLDERVRTEVPPASSDGIRAHRKVSWIRRTKTFDRVFFPEAVADNRVTQYCWIDGRTDAGSNSQSDTIWLGVNVLRITIVEQMLTTTSNFEEFSTRTAALGTRCWGAARVGNLHCL